MFRDFAETGHVALVQRLLDGTTLDLNVACYSASGVRASAAPCLPCAASTLPPYHAALASQWLPSVSLLPPGLPPNVPPV